jgi:hypothetical protein
VTTNAELKRLAEQATPGPWLYADNAPMSYGTAWINSDDVKSLAICDGTRRSETHGFCLQMNKDENERNARYIAAANPARIIALVDENERLREAGWQDISTAPRDGSEVLILAKGMVVQARFCPGSWGPDIPGEVREYDGAVWVAFDDQMQFEVEEGSLEGGHDDHGGVTHWQPLPAPPTLTTGEGE